MKLSKRTLGIFKTLSGVNDNIVFKTGKVQRAISQDSGVFVEAELDETFPHDVPICGLAQFVRNVECQEDADLSFEDNKYVSIATEHGVMKFGYGAFALIKQVPEKTLEHSPTHYSFKITRDQMERIKKFADINSFNTIDIENDKGELYISARDRTNQDSPTARFKLGAASANMPAWDESFAYDRFSKIPFADYDVKISPKMMGTFAGDRITYFVAAERTQK